MVHALKEAYRILVPGGTLIDVRPLSIDVPLEIVYEGGSVSAGMVDMSPCLYLDQEADKAIDHISTEGIITGVKLEYFYFAYYWKTVKGMEEDIDENWQGEVVISSDVWLKAHQLFNQRRRKTQVRLACRMKLGIYEKIVI